MACFDVKISSTTGKIERGETLKNKPSSTTFYMDSLMRQHGGLLAFLHSLHAAGEQFRLGELVGIDLG